MFYYIKGQIAHVEPALVVIDAGGVGYAINTSYTSASSVKKGDDATFYTHLHVREDIFELFGFSNQEELSCFKLLLGISGVGPKAALAILSAVPPSKLAVAVITNDEKTLCTANGVGKKLAQRIILELKDKMAKQAASDGELSFNELAASTMPTLGGALDDALAALAVLGYPKAQALAALKGADVSGLQTDEIVRMALKRLF